MADWPLIATFFGGFCLGAVFGVGGAIGWMAWPTGRIRNAYVGRLLHLDRAASAPGTRRGPAIAPLPARDPAVGTRGPAVSAMRALFVVGSTYQTFIACGLAAGQPRAAFRHLIIHIDFNDGAVLAETLRQMPTPLFDEITVLPRSMGLPHPRWRFVVAANILRTIGRTLRRRYDRVYIFNEDRPFHQAAAYWARRRNRHVVVYCTEDGTIDYAARTGWENRRFRNIASRWVLYGWWYRNATRRATVPWVDRHLLTHPEQLRRPAHDKPIERIPPVPFRGPAMADLAVAYLRRRGLADADVARLDGIVFLPKSNKVADRDAYVGAVRGLLSRARRAGVGLAVKHHPSEPLSDPFGLTGDPDIVRVPRGLVTEFLFLHPSCRLRYVIAGQSTALLAARWLRPEIVTISVAPLIGAFDGPVLTLLDNIGVTLVDDIDAVLPLLQPPGAASAAQ